MQFPVMRKVKFKKKRTKNRYLIRGRNTDSTDVRADPRPQKEQRIGI